MAFGYDALVLGFVFINRMIDNSIFFGMKFKTRKSQGKKVLIDKFHLSSTSVNNKYYWI